MTQISKEKFIDSLEFGDMVLVRSRGFMANRQNFVRKSHKEGPLLATHSLVMKMPPAITEADGKTINGKEEIFKYLNSDYKVWVFRYKNLRKTQRREMAIVMDAAERAVDKNSYPKLQLFAFYWKALLNKVGINIKLKDYMGMVCSEYSSVLARAPKLFYIHKEPHRVTPSFKLNWMFNVGCPSGYWNYISHFDGRGFDLW